MEANRSRLLAAARPYIQIYSIFGLTPPIQFFTRTLHKRRRGIVILGYACYLISISLMVIYECYANIVALQKDIHKFHAEDFSKVMGNTQKVLVVAMFVWNQLNILLNFRRLARIYDDIADLEIELNNASSGFVGQRHWWRFRFRLALSVGLWIVLLVGLTPRFTLVALGPYLHWTNKVLTEIILIMLQLKCTEYCVFVLLIYELILRGRHILKQISVELEGNQSRDSVQELCVALKRNQLLAGRIWGLVNEVSLYFTLSLTLLFLYNELTILHIVNWALIKSVNPNECCQYSKLVFKFKRYFTYKQVIFIIGRVGTCLLLSINIFLSCLYSEFCIQTVSLPI